MDDCVFCKIVSNQIPSSKILESDQAYAFLDISPATPYHALVIPKRHYADIFDIPAGELTAVTGLAKQVADLYAKKLGIRNVQILSNSGAEAQQDVFHLHFHVVPRSAGDGQDIRWAHHPEMRERFGEMLGKLA